jgi:signal transduction histidine kinase
MKRPGYVNSPLERTYTFPLVLLRLSIAQRLLIVSLTYILGVYGLWFFYPTLHSAASMLLPLICVCWLFSYRGLLISFLSMILTALFVYHYLHNAVLSDQSFVERVIIGLTIGLSISMIICWLRAAVDLVQAARQQAVTAEQKRLQALEAEHQITIAYEQERMINEQKDQFLVHVNHELRTPLTVLGASLELLKMYFESLEPEERARMLEQALGSYEELHNLVNGILDTLTITGTLPSFAQCERIVVRQVVQEMLNQLDLCDVEAYTIHLQVDEQILMWADPHYLQRVLQNLFQNIFKYVPKQTTITIEATQPTSLSPVCLSVQDEGPGIPPEELSLLFKKFVRLKRDLAGVKRGTGLGLYISRQLVETMGGRMWAESSGRMGEGSRFCVSLPSSDTFVESSPLESHVQ